ncbi:hypothetical protein [Streptomyces fagopyri]|uniref:hypothetical protein n=1 Tax=Streptomyces fagopyri TaxID=2662397 RepID=UPI0033F0D876
MSIGIAAGLAVLTAVGCAVAIADDDGRRLLSRSSYDPFRGSAAAQDWVAYSDHAAVIRVTREAAAKPDPKDGDYIPRTVTATVTQDHLGGEGLVHHAVGRPREGRTWRSDVRDHLRRA